MGHKFNSTEEMVEYFKKTRTLWERFILHPKINWLRWIIYNLPDLPKEIYQEVKGFIQRGKRGYADCDLWSFDDYLCKIISGSLSQFKRNLNGFPNNLTEKEWEIIIGKIIHTFWYAKNIINNHYIYCESENYDNQELKDFRNRMSELDFITIMTKEECLSYEEGWELFRKYFFNLWD